ncbi:hypothetical protein [Humibacter sp. RRB41]|uniref:hypothetical protein n=1 Tax=Humibacter sp. RRB41 TaxID=2919946 RepID=UPI001FA94C26|nr:hypothetical protein [Humibacter sp. RRB41]
MAIYGTQSKPSSKRTSVLGVWGARIVLIVVGVCAIISVVFILFGAGGGTLSRVISTDVALILFALLVWLDTTIGTYRPEWFEFSSLATDAYILLLWILVIWTDPNDGVLNLPTAIWHGFLCLIFIRGMLALVDLVRLLVRIWFTSVTRVLSYIAGAAFGAMAVLVTIPAPYPFNGLWDYDIYGRIVASLAVIGGVSLVLIPLWGLLINRTHGVRRTSTAAYPAYGAPYGGYPQAPAPGYSQPGYAQPGYPRPAYPQPGYPQQAQPAASAPAPVPAPSVPPVAQVPAPPVHTVSAPAVPDAAASAPLAPDAPETSAAVDATPPEPTPGPVAATAHASHPPLAWPRLSDGRPVPAGNDAKPDFAAVAGYALAWPNFADGTPVPAGPDGRPLYS